MAENLQADAEKDDKTAPRSRTQSKVAHPDQTKDLKTEDHKSEDGKKSTELSDEDKENGVTARSEPVDVPEEPKETERQKKARERAEKVAAEQAEQDDADIEAFLAVQRGERLLRGHDGSFDHVAFAAFQREERLAAAREDAGDEDEADDAEAQAKADEETKDEASARKSQDLGGRDATRRS